MGCCVLVACSPHSSSPSFLACDCAPQASASWAWAVHKEPAWCPQCKAPFSALLTHRKLDGSLSDFPVEESVCLLKRSTLVCTAHLKVPATACP